MIALLFALSSPSALAQDPPEDLVELTPSATLELVYQQDVGFYAGAEDALPVGPDHLAASSGHAVAVYDRIRREVVIADLDGVQRRVPAPDAEGLALAPDGRVYVLSRGQLTGYGADGAAFGAAEIDPPLGFGSRLEVSGAQIDRVYTDGSRQAVAAVAADGLTPIHDPHTIEPTTKVKVRDGSVTVGEDGVPVADVVRVSAEVLGGDPHWIQVTAVATHADGSLDVKSQARRHGEGYVDLPIADQPYPLTDGIAVTPEDRLVYLDPEADRVRIVWVDAP